MTASDLAAGGDEAQAGSSARPCSAVTLIDVAATLVTLGLLLVVALELPVEARIPLTVAFTTFVPGWALLNYHVVPGPVDVGRVALAVALSLAITTLSSVSVLWLHLWGPRALLSVVGSSCVLALVWHLVSTTAYRPPRLRFGAVRELRFSDLTLPYAVVLWWHGTQATEPANMTDYGLLAALPVTFFMGIGLLVVSIVVTVTRTALSPARLTLHLVALVVMLHATTPLIFDEPIYPWVYKHVGVVGYIDLFGTVDPGIDIYHSWPGFFALAAWFTEITGAASPLDFAAWAPLYFNLLICIELAFVFRHFSMSQRTRWVGLFLFVAGNWVGQDYFAPQAVAFILSLAVFGMALAWLPSTRLSPVIQFLRRQTTRASREAPGGSNDQAVAPTRPPPRLVVYGLLYLVFAAIVVTHQLTPYVVLLGLGTVSAAGLFRPRWVIAGLAAVAVGYLLLNLSALDQREDLFGSVLNPFANIFGSGEDDGSEVMTGRRLTALAAPLLILCLWTLAAVGLVRRLRSRQATLTLALLAVAPLLVALGQSYGGEAVFRIYLFSLPWVALLGASALDLGSAGRRLWAVLTTGVVTSAAVAMFMSATLGAAELYAVTSGERQASEYFYSHADAGSRLSLVAPNFPTRVGATYGLFTTEGDNPPDLLTSVPELRHRTLAAADLLTIAEFVAPPDAEGERDAYLVLSSSQTVYAEVLGLVPSGGLDQLDGLLAGSADWEVFHRNQDAVIYRYAPPAQKSRKAHHRLG